MHVFIPNFMTIGSSPGIPTPHRFKNSSYRNQLHRNLECEMEKTYILSSKRWKLASERSIRSKSALDYQDTIFEYENEPDLKLRHKHKTCFNQEISLIHSHRNNERQGRKLRIRNITKLSNTQPLQTKPAKITPFLMTRSLPYHQRTASQTTTSTSTRSHRPPEV